MARMCMISLIVIFSFQPAMAKDFRRNYTLEPGGQVFIENVLGAIRVKGFKGDSIEIVGIKKGDGSDLIEVLDNSIGIQELRYGPGRSARGRLGAGMQILHIRSVNGRVNLIKK